MKIKTGPDVVLNQACRNSYFLRAFFVNFGFSKINFS